MKLTSQQLNMIKELQRDPHCSETRATTYFLQICGKYHADPQKVVDAMSEGYEQFAKSKKEKLNGAS